MINHCNLAESLEEQCNNYSGGYQTSYFIIIIERITEHGTDNLWLTYTQIKISTVLPPPRCGLCLTLYLCRLQSTIIWTTDTVLESVMSHTYSGHSQFPTIAEEIRPVDEIHSPAAQFATAGPLSSKPCQQRNGRLYSEVSPEFSVLIMLHPAYPIVSIHLRSVSSRKAIQRRSQHGNAGRKEEALQNERDL